MQRYAIDLERDGMERIGVDLDGTLVRWYGDSSGEYIPDKIGEPVPAMVARVRRWLSEGYEVVIFTARVHPGHDEKGEAEVARKAIQTFCMEQFGRVLEVTCMKDPAMTRIYDDRAITVEKDTGRILTEGIEAMEDAEDVPDSLGSQF